MRLSDYLQFNLQVFTRHWVRSVLILLAVAIGVAAVVLLTGLGEGARLYVDREFSALGNKLLIIVPGRKETTGGMPPLFGSTPRDLTLEDAQAIAKIPTVNATAPIIAGTIEATYGRRSRDVLTLGSTPDLFVVRQLTVSQGRLLPQSSYTQAQSIVVLGAKLKRELFGSSNAVGEWLRLGGSRYRVVGILSERGESLGLDMSDLAIIPVRSAEQLFNAPALFRIIMELKQEQSAQYTETKIRALIRERHEGEDDVTIINQDSVIGAFNKIIGTLTLVVGAIASISLLVAGILIMNVSLISVSQRRQEIGLLKALGASANNVRNLFVGEALLLVIGGCVAGLVIAQSVLFVARYLYPTLPLEAPWWAMLAAVTVAAACGLGFSWWPARQAASLDPVLAMRGEL